MQLCIAVKHYRNCICQLTASIKRKRNEITVANSERNKSS